MAEPSHNHFGRNILLATGAAFLVAGLMALATMVLLRHIHPRPVPAPVSASRL